MRDVVNEWSGWRRPVTVWGRRMTPPTFDRAVYLRLHRWGWMGRGERRWFEREVRPGMIAVDVGANVGVYSLLFGQLVGPEGRVFAVEPHPHLCDALRRNIAENAMPYISVVPCAAGAREGRARLCRPGWNSGDVYVSAAAADDGAVAVRPLGDLVDSQRVDFIKIDVQGRERDVLLGARPLLESNPAAVIYFELWPRGLERAGSSVADLAATLNDLGLGVFRPLPDGAVEPVSLPDAARTLRPGGYINLVARR